MKRRRVSLLEVFAAKDARLLKVLLIVYVASFLGATYNHGMDLILHGLFPYQRLNSAVSPFLNAYWTLLTLLDPLAILLLWFSIDLGLVAYGLVILSDVLINYSFMISTKGLFSVINAGQVSQLLFLIFYLCTVRHLHVKSQALQVRRH